MLIISINYSIFQIRIRTYWETTFEFWFSEGPQTKETYGWVFRRHMEKINEFPKILRNGSNNFEICSIFGLISRYYAEKFALLRLGWDAEMLRIHWTKRNFSNNRYENAEMLRAFTDFKRNMNVLFKCKEIYENKGKNLDINSEHKF